MTERVCDRDRMNVERIGARGFTVLGGVFWTVAAFAGPYAFGDRNLGGAFGLAIYPLVFTVAALVVGWFYERTAALILGAAAAGTVAWGLIMGWEPFVWGIMLFFFVAPTVVAAVLYYLAGDMAEVCALSTTNPEARTAP